MSFLLHLPGWNIFQGGGVVGPLRSQERHILSPIPTGAEYIPSPEFTIKQTDGIVFQRKEIHLNRQRRKERQEEKRIDHSPLLTGAEYIPRPTTVLRAQKESSALYNYGRTIPLQLLTTIQPGATGIHGGNHCPLITGTDYSAYLHGNAVFGEATHDVDK